MKTHSSEIARSSEEQKVATALMVGFFCGFLLPWLFNLGDALGAQASFAVFSSVATAHYVYRKLTGGLQSRRKA